MRFHLVVSIGGAEEKTFGKFQIREIGHRTETKAGEPIVSKDVGLLGIRVVRRFRNFNRRSWMVGKLALP
jgi:hypothetical protein